EKVTAPLVSTGELEKKLKSSLEKLQQALPALSTTDERPPAAPPGSGAGDKPGRPATSVVAPQPMPPPLPPIGGITVPAPKAIESGETKPGQETMQKPSIRPVLSESSQGNVVVRVDSSHDFQKRLVDLELKFLQETREALAGRLKALPDNDAERSRLAAEHQRIVERIQRLLRAAELAAAHYEALTTARPVLGESPWTIHLETVEGRTVLQAVVHRKARFKITCDRLDLQAPRGTVLAVGRVAIAGEGFQGNCERLSIPLHDDRLILEGGAEVSVRTQTVAVSDTAREGQPPLVDSRRHDESATTGVPLLHLKGDHLDLRWSDLQPSGSNGARLDEPADGKVIRATPGPMVKVAFHGSGNEKWSEWGILQRVKDAAAGQPEYQIVDGSGKPIVYVHTPSGFSLAEYLGKRVSVFGRVATLDRTAPGLSNRDVRVVPVITASHVAWE
ncbi:MAG: hypothetical protein NZO58_10940, partial [Gemmataceae bacterium]|nr:hypothetical protein [Gemmataceae bacterium]